MRMIRKEFFKRTAAAGCAFLLALVFPAEVLADGPGEAPTQEYLAYMAQLEDSHMEYEEIPDLIKNFYGPIKSAYDRMENSEEDQAQIAVESRIMARDLLDQAEALEDAIDQIPASDIVDVQTEIVTNRMTAKQMRSTAASLDRSMEKSGARNEKTLNRQLNTLVYNVQLLMNQYEQLLSQRAVAAKALEIAETARQIQQTMEAQGLAVSGDVLSAAAQAASARSTLNSLDDTISQLYKSLCSFTGYDADENPEIGPVPAADVGAIASIDVNADKEKAVGNNYELISLRSSAGGGMSDLQVRTTKTTTQTKNKLRNVEYSEDSLRSSIQTLYDTILEQKAAYDSAATAMQSAQLTWNAAQLQWQNGSLSQLGYLQQELAYLQAQSGFTCADLALQQAMQNYDWAVKGVTVSAE